MKTFKMHQKPTTACKMTSATKHNVYRVWALNAKSVFLGSFHVISRFSIKMQTSGSQFNRLVYFNYTSYVLK